MAILIKDKVWVNERKLADQLIQKGFGEWKNHKLVLDMLEANLLLEKDKLEVFDSKNKKIDAENLVKKAQLMDKRFGTKYVVYSDLRERGFVTKTGFKFGADFRVYPRGKKPGEEHTQWVVHAQTQNEKFTLTEFSRFVRLAGNLRTVLLFAVVDSEDDINYYEIKRITP